MQTIRDTDAAVIRNSRVNWNSARMRVQEENSTGENTAHAEETAAYLAIDEMGDFRNQAGELIGETGRIKTTDEWLTVTLENSYNNPVVIANSLSLDDFDPATVRVRNVTEIVLRLG